MLRVTEINHKTCQDEMETLGKFSLTKETSVEFINSLIEKGIIKQGFGFFTCSRTAIYYDNGKNVSGQIIDELHKFLGIKDDHSKLFEHHHGKDAIEYAAKTATGMLAINDGEVSVAGQFKKIIDDAINSGMNYKALERLTSSIVADVRNNTKYNRADSEYTYLAALLEKSIRHDNQWVLDTNNADLIEDNLNKHFKADRILVVGTSYIVENKILPPIKDIDFYSETPRNQNYLDNSQNYIAISSPAAIKINESASILAKENKNLHLINVDKKGWANDLDKFDNIILTSASNDADKVIKLSLEDALKIKPGTNLYDYTPKAVSTPQFFLNDKIRKMFEDKAVNIIPPEKSIYTIAREKKITPIEYKNLEEVIGTFDVIALGVSAQSNKDGTTVALTKELAEKVKPGSLVLDYCQPASLTEETKKILTDKGVRLKNVLEIMAEIKDTGPEHLIQKAKALDLLRTHIDKVYEAIAVPTNKIECTACPLKVISEDKCHSLANERASGQPCYA